MKELHVPKEVIEFTVELQWLEHLWNHEKYSRLWYFELMSVNHSGQVRRHDGGYIFYFL